MLEWLKDILGDAYTEEIDKAVSSEIGKGFVARTDFNSKNDELKAANATIKSLQDAAKEFDGVDVKALKDSLADAEKKYNEQLAQLKLDSAIDVALAGSKARNNKAVRAMLDLSEVKLDDAGALTGLDDQLSSLRKENAWLFEGAETINTGTEHGAGLGGDEDGVIAAFKALNPSLKL